MSDLIDRQAAISAICNACGKIDCDKMDKCEKLQLPPANNSEIPNSSDTISRAKAIEICDHAIDLLKGQFGAGALVAIKESIEQLPPAQPEQLEQCPIYGGMCAYPSNQCYDCPRHAGAKMEVTT
jgi:hypothetical protein